MEFGLLGPLEVREGDRPLRLGRRKQRALLALLLLNANRVVARERLIDALWGENPPETAVKAVQVHVSQLRKFLPKGTLVTRPPGYLLELDAEALDLQRFERLVEAARSVDPARASSLLGEALGLWRGPPLAEFGDEPFARAEAGRLEGLRLAALEERIEADLALGRHAELIGELEALTAEHPHRERVRGQLMLALYRSGRQTEALEEYRHARAALDEVGIEPGVGLRQLEKQILGQDAALDLRSHRLLSAALGERIALPGPLVSAPSFPFVGRTGELAVLRSLVERAEGGEGGLVLLAGEAGGGKTRLVRELAQEAATRGVLVLYGASDAAVSTPYQPLREWLDFVLRVCDRDALTERLGGCEALARLVPEFARLTGTPAPPPGDPEGDRYLLQSAAVELLRRLSRLKPLVLVADDLHWADSETLHLLRRLARTVPEARLLVLAVFRDRGEEIGPTLADTLAELARIDGVTRLSLGNLSNEDMRAFIIGSAHAEATAELVATLGELTGGTPLLLCELWRDLRESGAVEVSDTGVHLSRPVAMLRGPERIRDVVRQRLTRLTPETTSTLELAAVAGPRFELRVLADAAGLDQRALVVAVQEAIRSGIVEDVPEPPPACRFAHELVRRAIYEGIVGIRRAALHLRIAEALERAHQADPTRVIPELAHHFTLAASVGGAERAVDYNLRAADAAIASAAYDEGVARLSSALELGIGDSRERARVQVELAYLLRGTARTAESETLLAASLDAATGLGERGVAARVLVHRQGYRRTGDPRADPEQMLTVVQRAIETLTELGDASGLAVAGRWLAIVLRRQGRLAETCAAAERALVHANACGDQDARRQVIGTLTYALCDGPAPVGDAIRRCEELLESSRNDRALEAIVGRCLSMLLAMAGRFEEAREHSRRSGLVLDELNHRPGSWIYRTVAAEAKELLGDVAGAEQELTATWQYYRDVGDYAPDAHVMDAAYQLAFLCCDEGRWDDAERCLTYGSEVPVPAYFLHEAVLGLAGRARLAAHHGRLVEAVTLAQRGLELAERSDMLNLRARVWLAHAEVQQAVGRIADSDAAAAEAVRLYEAKGNVAAAALLRAGGHGAPEQV
jgi:DNA-binding SARP family transcriptional activator/tetratricopeptide (TPR) repeat protein